MLRKFGLWIGILLVVVAVLAINVIAGFGLRGARIDATEDRAYTLTQGSRNIAKSPAEPISLTFYYSAKVAQGQAGLQSYAQRVRELLEEYKRASGGKITLTVVDPEPFSEAEDRAMESGVAGAPLGNGQKFYLGLSGTNSIDTRETIAFFEPGRERFLEYDISRMITSLANPRKRVVGWISPLQLEGGNRMNPRTRQPEPTMIYRVMQEMKSAYEVRRLDTTISEVPKDIDVLLVVHPKDLPEPLQFAIDQYVLRGGRLLLFVDPLCEADEGEQQFPTALGRASSLEKLLTTWGVEVPSDQVVADQDIAARVFTRASQEQVPYILWLECGKENVNKDDAVTGQVEKVTLASSGFVRTLEKKEGETRPRATVTPLIESTARAATMMVEAVEFPPDPRKMFNEFVPGTQKYTLAARLSGSVASAFADGLPKNADGTDITVEGGVLKESTGSINVLVFADADIITDAQWVQRRQIIPGMESLVKMSDNGETVLAGVDNMAGSTDLIAVRARKEATRPFTKVQEMEKTAQQQYAKELARIENEMQSTQQRLAQLQTERGGDQSGGLVLTPEQQKELQDLQKKLLDSRKTQREVQHKLNEDIDSLGTLLLWLNSALMPAALIVAALVIVVVRGMQRRRAAA
ncbi:MAG TPA: Gldg family protein [Phycisphaerales bacterium]|nr:Gldg family protein [Phycisphaerales bacterium]